MKVECKKHYLFHESTEQCPDCRAAHVETVLAEHSDWDDNEETKDYSAWIDACLTRWQDRVYEGIRLNPRS